jgi:phosphoserine phosphatase
VEANKVQPRDFLNHSQLMDGMVALIEYWQVDPRKTVMVSGAPDYIFYVERTIVGQ